MTRLRFLNRVLLLAIAAIAFTAAETRADLSIRVSSFNSAGTALGGTSSLTDTLVLSDPAPGSASQSHTFTVTDFSVVITSNIANSGGNVTSHSLTINVTYTGSGTGASSDQLVVEFLGTNYVHPGASPPPAFVMSNASPSTTGLKAGSIGVGGVNGVKMISGVNNANGGLPASALVSNDLVTSGLSGLTTGVGTMGSASSVLMPNPVTSPNFDISSKFSFYQAFLLNNLTPTGSVVSGGRTGSLSAGSFVSAVPEPSSMAMALAGAPLLGLLAWRRRRKAQA